MQSLSALKIQTAISAMVTAVGLVLMAAKIYWDSEPGAIPLALVFLGIGWFFITQIRIRSRRKRQ